LQKVIRIREFTKAKEDVLLKLKVAKRLLINNVSSRTRVVLFKLKDIVLLRKRTGIVFEALITKKRLRF
jgi:hypothetical protein